MDAPENLEQATLHEIPRAECLNLLGLARVGRVVFMDDEGPLALPVNFRMDGETVLFRVSPSSDMCMRLNDANVSFQVDRLDDFHQTGWSVLVRGRSSYVESEDLPKQQSTRPVPWAEGFRSTYVRIRPTQISGRRLTDD